MEMIDQVAAVLAVLGVLTAVTWWLRRRGILQPNVSRRSLGRRLESLERLPLGPQQTLHLVRVGSRALLVAATPSGCALLDSVEIGNLERTGGEAVE
jgi:flagellar biosynthetic protein FliO